MAAQSQRKSCKHDSLTKTVVATRLNLFFSFAGRAVRTVTAAQRVIQIPIKRNCDCVRYRPILYTLWPNS